MELNSEVQKKDPYIALRFKEFRSYLLMRFFLTIGYQVQGVVIGWYIYSITKDPLSLGLIGLAEAVPAIGIALYGGYIADKSNKKSLLQKVVGLILLSSTVLFIITLPSVTVRLGESLLISLIYVMIFVNGIARGFYAPTAFSLMAMIIPREHYPNSSTWNSSAWQIASIGGPAIGGLLYGFAGINHTFFFILVCLSIAFISTFFFKSRPSTYVQTTNILQSLSEGLRFVFKSKMLLGALSLDLFSVFFGGAVALIPVIATEILHVGATEFGFLRAAPAVGAVVTMLLMTRFSPMGKPWRNLLFAVTGFGISIICYGLSTNFYLTLFFLFLEGAFDSVSVIIRSTILQLLTPDDMRGRVSAVNSMFIGSSNEIGQFESGLTAKLMRTVPAVVFGGSMTLLVAGVTWLKTKKLVSLTLDDINKL
ncbi:MFS transporter [Pedobacter psychrophilus]|uniref:MFS transporter n=1 Tax=Pedobacter psychrophilus TaxID=1826909 RepID=A0A179DIC3_9SPHI|nr:MFS transporter [Pedobacter psychrophilus]OAQ40470.1 MFS transporter [Pedobacter psychrophilus]